LAAKLVAVAQLFDVMAMKILNYFNKAIKRGRQYWPIALTVYAIELALVLTVGLQVYQVLEASIGSSLEVQKLTNGYDFTVFTDFLKVHGASITPLLGQLRWLILLWLLVSVFLQGGMLWTVTARPEHNKMSGFWSHCSRYFFPFLGIGVFFLALALISGAALLLPTLSNFETIIANSESEKTLVFRILAGLIVWALVLILLYIWAIQSRIVYIRWQDNGIWKAIRGGFTRTWRMLGRNLAIVLTALTVMACIGFYYNHLALLVGSQNGIALIGLFLLQQVFSIFRTFLRMGVYALFDRP
jgi:hypothetical protein